MQQMCPFAANAAGRLVTSLGQFATGSTKIQIADFGNRGGAILEDTVLGFPPAGRAANALTKTGTGPALSWLG